MEKSLFGQFEEIHPEFMGEIDLLPKNLSTRFKNKFIAESNKTNFLSLLSEFRFVEFFVKEGLTFDYDTTYKNLKPDIRIKLNEQEVIGDIKRFNLSESDQIKEDFFYRLARNLKSINKPYYVRIKQTKPFAYSTVDVDEIKHDFMIWVSKENINVGDTFYFKDMFSIEVTKLNGIRDYILYSYSTLDNKINPNKILNIIRDKITAYEEAFIDKGIPFFICVDMVFEAMIDPEEFEVKYLGGLSLNINDSTESFDLGKFYNDTKFGKIIGILLRYNGDFYWVKNPRHQKVLNFKTTKEIK